MASSVALARSKQTSTSGGSRDSDETALAVVPTGSPPGPTEVMTVTPVAKWPMACLNSSPLTAGLVSGGSSSAVMGGPGKHYLSTSPGQYNRYCS